MRLHRLTVTAFGPFGGTQHVDFDALSAAGLFLLHGPTGAGKTSVLDAVCYALYGSVPGARQGSGLSLRSDHAAADLPTEVTLELTVGGRRLEITRRPEQLRPKKKGTGFTREKPYSALRENDGGEWKGLSRSHQEIGEEITQLLGMSREQFCQVVLLPQGDFARFLRAEDTARSRLLGRLFDTGRFAAVENHLAERRRAAEARVRVGDEQLLALAHRMRQAAADRSLPEVGTPAPSRAGEPARAGAAPSGGGSSVAGRAVPRAPFGAQGTGTFSGPRPEGARGTARATTTRPQSTAGGDGGSVGAARPAGAVPAPRSPEGPLGPGDPGLVEVILEWAALARANAREERDIAGLALRAAEKDHRGTHERAEEARDLARLQRRYDAARQRAAGLAEQRGELEPVRGRLTAARAAEAVAPALELRDEAGRAHRAAAVAESAARHRLPEGHRDAGGEQLAALERRFREELGSLTAARRAEQRAATATAEAARLDREARADEEAVTEAASWLADWDGRRHALRQRVDAAQDAAARAEQLGGRTGPARERLDAARHRDTLTGEADGAEARLLHAREQAAAAREHWLELKDRRLRGIAAELAAGLEPGAPCAVCGATEHPAPARAAAEHPDRAAEEAALHASQAAEARRDEAARQVQTLREALAAATATAGTAPTGQLAEEAAALERSLAEAQAAAADLHTAREALAGAEREYERRRHEQQDARLRIAARTSHREDLDRELHSLEEELTQARGGEESVERRAALLEQQLGRLAEAAEAVRGADAAAGRLKEADDRLADAAYRAGFDTPGQAADALLEAVEQRRLQERLDRWQSEEAAVAAELADASLAAAAARPPADPAAAQAAADAATRRLQAAAAEDAAARTRCAELDRLSRRAAADAVRLAPLREEHHRVAGLAALAAGTSARNERKMRLESYVLAARLEQVAAAATVRLQRMSGGRYTLVHSDARAGGRGRSGLGLHVVDAWTGSARDTATLSGGETFFASLALALGLADVVTEEAGGTRLDTLFIDEGFGTLDEQTLDEVLDVLDSLRERDRTVGIVSHVADLRQRIPAQLQVVKGRSGSAVRHRTAEPS